jgi:hypothetical protein
MAVIALCFLCGKKLLGGNRVGDVTDIAPHRQLDRSQIAQLAFRRFERSLDEPLGGGTPISKHEIPHVSPTAIVLEKSDRFLTPLVPGWCVDNLFLQNDFIVGGSER